MNEENFDYSYTAVVRYALFEETGQPGSIIAAEAPEGAKVGDLLAPSQLGAHDGGVIVGFREEERTFHRIKRTFYRHVGP